MLNHRVGSGVCGGQMQVVIKVVEMIINKITQQLCLLQWAWLIAALSGACCKGGCTCSDQWILGVEHGYRGVARGIEVGDAYPGWNC